MNPDCGAMFHHTTASGYCRNCGGSWKKRRRGSGYPLCEGCGQPITPEVEHTFCCLGMD